MLFNRQVSKDLKEVKTWSCENIWGDEFQVEGKVNAKSLRSEYVWCVQGKAEVSVVRTEDGRRWDWVKVMGGLGKNLAFTPSETGSHRRALNKDWSDCSRREDRSGQGWKLGAQ